MTRLSSHLLKGLNKTAQSHYPLGGTHFEPPFSFPPPQHWHPVPLGVEVAAVLVTVRWVRTEQSAEQLMGL